MKRGFDRCPKQGTFVVGAPLLCIDFCRYDAIGFGSAHYDQSRPLNELDRLKICLFNPIIGCYCTFTPIIMHQVTQYKSWCRYDGIALSYDARQVAPRNLIIIRRKVSVRQVLSLRIGSFCARRPVMHDPYTLRQHYIWSRLERGATRLQVKNCIQPFVAPSVLR